MRHQTWAPERKALGSRGLEYVLVTIAALGFAVYVSDIIGSMAENPLAAVAATLDSATAAGGSHRLSD